MIPSTVFICAWCQTQHTTRSPHDHTSEYVLIDTRKYFRYLNEVYLSHIKAKLRREDRAKGTTAAQQQSSTQAPSPGHSRASHAGVRRSLIPQVAAKFSPGLLAERRLAREAILAGRGCRGGHRAPARKTGGAVRVGIAGVDGGVAVAAFRRCGGRRRRC